MSLPSRVFCDQKALSKFNYLDVNELDVNYISNVSLLFVNKYHSAANKSEQI